MGILRRFWWGIKLALILIFGFSASAFAATPEDIVGTWARQLEAGAIKLRVLFNISAAPDGNLMSTLDSPDQGANGIPVNVTTFDGSKLRIEVRRIQGTFEGTLKPGEKVIEGVWTQVGGSLPLTLRPSERIALKRPQEPKKPYPYAEEEVGYESLKAGPHFAGTLTKPQGKGPFPAVLMITGSGPQNRDEELVGHKPFLVIADDLTRRGIAVLRVDDRGVGGTTGDMKTATSEDFVADVLAGVAFLKSRADIDPRRIGLVGHSEGGLIAPIAAVRSKDVLFFQAQDKYTRVVTVHDEALIRTPLKERAQSLDSEDFRQVHRSVIVRAHAIRAVHRDSEGRLLLQVKERTDQLPVSSAFQYRFKGM